MMSTHARLAALTVLLSAVAGLVSAAEPLELRWRFKRGQILKYVLKHHEVRHTEIGSLTAETTTDSEYDLHWTVKELGTTWLNTPLRGPLKISKLSGEVRFDPAAGMVRDSRLEMTMAGALKLGESANAGLLRLRLQHVLGLAAKP